MIDNMIACACCWYAAGDGTFDAGRVLQRACASCFICRGFLLHVVGFHVADS
jgi:hypothetical protein